MERPHFLRVVQALALVSGFGPVAIVAGTSLLGCGLSSSTPTGVQGPLDAAPDAVSVTTGTLPACTLDEAGTCVDASVGSGGIQVAPTPRLTSSSPSAARSPPRAPRVSDVRPIGMPADETPIGKEYRHVATTMMRCTRAVRDFDAKAYDPRAVEQARAMWKVRMLSEYRLTSVFSALAAQLMEARASLEATTVVLRMGQDELRHAEACGEALVALGAKAAESDD